MKNRIQNTRKQFVLVIDDDAAQLKTIADILESENLQPICCSTGKEAIEAVKRQELNVAILDLRLPDIEGLELLKKLKQHNPEIKVIINTGYASLESALEAINEEVYAYVRKMGNVEELLAHVHRAFHVHLTSYSEKLEREVKKRTADLLRTNKQLNQEINERKKTENALEQAKNEWEITFDAMSDWVCLMDLKRKIVRTNRVGEAFTNLSLSKIVGKTCCKVVHGTEQSLPGCPLQNMLKTGKKESVEIQLPESDSWLLVTVDPVLDREGDIQSVVHIARDITERKLAEKALRESEEKFRSLAEKSPNMIFINQLGRIVYVNEKCEEIMKYKKEEFYSQDFDFLNLLAPESKSFAIEHFRKHKTGEEVPSFEYTLLTKDGIRIHAIHSTRLIKYGGECAILGIITDITERKQAMIALQVERDKAQMYLDIVGVVLVVIETDRQVSLINRKGCEILGYEEEEIIGKDWFDNFLPKRDRDMVKGVFAKLIAGDIAPVEHFENRILTKEGEERIILWHNTVITDEAGTIIRTLSSGQDITESKQAEEALKQRTYDLGERVKEINCLFQVSQLLVEHILPLDEIFQKMVELLPPAWQYPEITCSRILFNKKSYTTPNWQETAWKQSADIRSSEGKVGMLEVDYLEEKPELDEGPFLKEERDLIEALGRMLGDYVERKRAEEELKRSKEWFSAIFDASRDGIVVEDNEIITYSNSAFAKHYGYDSVDELIGRHVSVMQSEEDNEKMLEFDRRRVSGKPAPALYEFKGKQKNGALIDSEASVSSVDITGKSFVITVIRDITERKRLEEQLFQSQKMEAIGRLAGGIAHDFNNLLTVILGNAEFGLQDSNPGDPVQLDLINIEKAATEASDLVRQLLTFSKSQAYKPNSVNLNNIIINHMKMLRRIIGEHIALNTNLDKKLSQIWADSAQIQRILMNLSVNARDAMPKGGELIIETRNFVADDNFYYELTQAGTQAKSKNESRNYVELTIIDTGRGMDKETLNRIFDPFFTTKKIGDGTGLGLAVVYGIVKQHNGLIKVDSQLGQGASFKIYLPTTSESAEQALKNERKANIHRGEETILVVEDEAAVRNVTLRILNELVPEL